MATSTAVIGNLWQEGETLKDSGAFHEAILKYQRAKSLLIKESKNMYDEKLGGGTPKYLGEIMEKLTGSIEKVLGVLSKNPILVLGLPRGYTQGEVKKHYRKMALKYHPDKNTDCDSSCLFTLIQTAYERVLPGAPVEKSIIEHNQFPSHMYKDHHEHFTRHHPHGSSEHATTSSSSKNSGKHGTTGDGNTQPQAKPPGASMHSSFFSARPTPPAAAAAANKEPPASASRSNRRPSSSATSASAKKQANTASSASTVSTMSTAELREAIRVFGFTGVDKMNREQLLKKMLAIKAYLERQKEAASKEPPPADEPKNPSSGFKPQSGKDWASHWEEEIRRGMEGNNRPQRNDLKKEREAQQRWDEAQMRYQAETKRAAEAERNGSQKNRDAAADEQRQKRADVLARELPDMPIAELKRMMLANRIPLDGCVEKSDLLEKLYKYFGIKPLYPTEPPGVKSDSYEFHNRKEVPSERWAAEHAKPDPKHSFFSEKQNVADRSSGSVLPKIVKENIAEINSKNKAKMNNIMEDDDLKFVIGKASNKSGGSDASRPKTPAPDYGVGLSSGQADEAKEGSNGTGNISGKPSPSTDDIMKKNLNNASIWTTEKLKSLEQKMMGRGIRPRAQPVKETDEPSSGKSDVNTTAAQATTSPEILNTSGEEKSDQEYFSPHIATIDKQPLSDKKSPSTAGPASIPGSDSSKEGRKRRSRFSPEKNDNLPSITKDQNQKEGVKHPPTENSSHGPRPRSSYKSIVEEQQKLLRDQISEQESELNNMKFFEEELKRQIASDKAALKKKLHEEEESNFYIFEHGKDKDGKRVDSHALREEFKTNNKKYFSSGGLDSAAILSPIEKSSFTKRSHEDLHAGTRDKNTAIKSPQQTEIGQRTSTNNDNEVEPQVVLQHGGFSYGLAGEDDDEDVETYIGGNETTFKTNEPKRKDYLDDVYGLGGVSDEPGIIEEKVAKAKRVHRKTMPDTYSTVPVLNTYSSRMKPKQPVKLPNEFPDDFLDLPFEHFMPPVKEKPYSSSGSRSKQLDAGISLQPSTALLYHTPHDRHGSSISLASNSSVDYQISLPVGGMGVGLDEDEDDVDDTSIDTSGLIPSTGHSPGHSIAGSAGAHTSSSHGAPHSTISQMYANTEAVEETLPPIFHKTIRVEGKSQGEVKYSQQSPEKSPQKFNFSNKLDSFGHDE